MARALQAIVILLAAVAITVVVTTDDDGNGGHHQTITVTLGGPGHDQIPLTPPAQKIAATQKTQDAAGNEDAAHSDLRAEPPASQTPEVLEHEKSLTPPAQPLIPKHPPLATVSQPGCRTLLVRNFSSRQGSPILLIVLHYTVSPDSAWNGVLANVRWFDTSAAQASSNYIIARTGECAYIVPETQKAWAQAGFNRVALSVEVTNTGRYSSYLLPGGRSRLVQLLVAMHKRWHVPLRHGAVSGCNVTRSGVVEHFDLKACGGGHVDDTPYHAEVNAIIAAAAKASAPKTGLAAAKRSHRIVHAKITKRCRGVHPRPAGCVALYKRNGELHAKWGSRL